MVVENFYKCDHVIMFGVCLVFFLSFREVLEVE